MTSMSVNQAQRGSLVTTAADSVEFDLTETDVYSFETFQDLQDQRFAAGVPLYICVAEGDGKNFLFEGSRFLEQVIRKRREILNPMTRVPITEFKVYRSTREAPEFVQVFDQDTVQQDENDLPILWSDLTRTDAGRGKWYARMGSHLHEQGRIEEAVQHWRCGAILGYKDSEYNLSVVLEKQKHIKESLFWGLSYWKSQKKLNLEDPYRFAYGLESLGKYHAAFAFYAYGATLGDRFSLAKLIAYCERGHGPREVLPALRELLPEGWRRKEMREYMQYLVYNKAETQGNAQQLPAEIMSNLNIPNPRDLFPKVASFVDRRSREVYRSEATHGELISKI